MSEYNNDDDLHHHHADDHDNNDNDDEDDNDDDSCWEANIASRSAVVDRLRNATALL